MKNVGFILVLSLLGVLTSIKAEADHSVQLLTTRDQSTGPFNPNQPPPWSLPRGA
jgi:hypothetical protein